MKRIFLYISMFIAGASFNSCSDLLDTETLSTDNLNYLCSNATDARKMVDHVYAYFCEDTYTSRMSTNWMQNTDVEIEVLESCVPVTRLTLAIRGFVRPTSLGLRIAKVNRETR